LQENAKKKEKKINKNKIKMKKINKKKKFNTEIIIIKKK